MIKEKTYKCPCCGYRQNFDEAYMDSGECCPSCGLKLNIPLSYWIHI